MKTHILCSIYAVIDLRGGSPKLTEAIAGTFLLRLQRETGDPQQQRQWPPSQPACPCQLSTRSRAGRRIGATLNDGSPRRARAGCLSKISQSSSKSQTRQDDNQSINKCQSQKKN